MRVKNAVKRKSIYNSETPIKLRKTDDAVNQKTPNKSPSTKNKQILEEVEVEFSSSSESEYEGNWKVDASMNEAFFSDKQNDLEDSADSNNEEESDSDEENNEGEEVEQNDSDEDNEINEESNSDEENVLQDFEHANGNEQESDFDEENDEDQNDSESEENDSDEEVDIIEEYDSDEENVLKGFENANGNEQESDSFEENDDQNDSENEECEQNDSDEVDMIEEYDSDEENVLQDFEDANGNEQESESDEVDMNEEYDSDEENVLQAFEYASDSEHETDSDEENNEDQSDNEKKEVMQNNSEKKVMNQPNPRKTTHLDRCKYTVYVTGLQGVDFQISDIFKDCKYTYYAMLKNHPTGKPIGSAFVNFDEEENYKKALEKNGVVINGVTITVLPKRSKEENQTYNIFVRNLSPNSKIEHIFSDCKILSHRIFPHSKSAFLYLGNEDSVQKALKKDQTEHDGYTITVYRKDCSVFIKGLSGNTKIEKLFSNCKIHNHRLFKHKITGNLNGTVHFADILSYKNALAKNGTKILGKTIIVEPFKPKTDRNKNNKNNTKKKEKILQLQAPTWQLNMNAKKLESENGNKSVFKKNTNKKFKKNTNKPFKKNTNKPFKKNTNKPFLKKNSNKTIAKKKNNPKNDT